MRGPNREPGLRTPVTIFKSWVNASVSTPVFVDDTLISAAYDDKVHLYHVDYRPAQASTKGALKSRDGHWWTVTLKETASFTGGSAFESTPLVWDGRVYIGCRDGWFYCLGAR